MRNKLSRLLISEVMTIIVLFHQYGFLILGFITLNLSSCHLTGRFPD
ncbi:hypothetical protein [Candidatus Enterovibrio escicola]|nr:hypothetical protein [Candidatus Enterovibrio escacola]